MNTQEKEIESPNGANMELTIVIDSDKWAEREAKGYSNSDIEKELIEDIRHAITHHARGGVVWDIEELHVRKYY